MCCLREFLHPMNGGHCKGGIKVECQAVVAPISEFFSLLGARARLTIQENEVIVALSPEVQKASTDPALQ